ncbi:MAG: peptidase C39 family protein [Syntrophaceae bacterium]|nr:peptidase C39 family protein [Syntrophaceae bacterium]
MTKLGGHSSSGHHSVRLFVREVKGRGHLEKGCSLLLFLLIVVQISACARASVIPQSSSKRNIENVPFYPQEAYQCGPASMAGVFSYWKVKVSPEEIAEEIYSPSAKGTLTLDMVLYAERKGLKANWYKGSLEDIKEKVDSGHPVIVLVDLGFWFYQQNHFMVVTGYDERGVIVNSGRERQKFIPARDFLRSWRRTNFLTLWITPK